MEGNMIGHYFHKNIIHITRVLNFRCIIAPISSVAPVVLVALIWRQNEAACRTPGVGERGAG